MPVPHFAMWMFCFNEAAVNSPRKRPTAETPTSVWSRFNEAAVNSPRKLFHEIRNWEFRTGFNEAAVNSPRKR